MCDRDCDQKLDDESVVVLVYVLVSCTLGNGAFGCVLVI